METRTYEVPSDVPIPENPDTDEMTYKFRSTGRGGYHPEYTILRGINDGWPVPIGIVRRLRDGDWNSSPDWEASIKGGAWTVRGDSRKNAVRALERRIIPQGYWDRKNAEYEAAEQARRDERQAQLDADIARVRRLEQLMVGVGGVITFDSLIQDTSTGWGSRVFTTEQIIEMLEQLARFAGLYPEES